MSQTVRYAKVRTAQDPDHDNDEYNPAGCGMYFGTNMTTRQLGPGWTHRAVNTRGAFGGTRKG